MEIDIYQSSPGEEKAGERAVKSGDDHSAAADRSTSCRVSVRAEILFAANDAKGAECDRAAAERWRVRCSDFRLG